nr:MAG TPA: hypothetical protein [Caudoviricetes sp.]
MLNCYFVNFHFIYLRALISLSTFMCEYGIIFFYIK